MLPDSAIQLSGTGANRTLTVTPPTGKTGTASLTLTLTDDQQETSTLSFKVTVEPPKDTTPPTATFSPADEANNIAVSSTLTLTFSEPVVKGNGSILLTPAGGNPVTIDVIDDQVSLSSDGLTATIQPVAGLNSATTYTVTVEKGAFQDQAGNDYAGITDSNAWNFTTQAASGSTPSPTPPPAPSPTPSPSLTPNPTPGLTPKPPAPGLIPTPTPSPTLTPVTNALDSQPLAAVPAPINFTQGKPGIRMQGTSNPDRIQGTSGNDRIFALGGNDFVNAGAGNDFVSGGKGRDTLKGGSGDDYLDGGKGNDVLMGGAGNDVMIGGLGIDTLTGGAGADQFVLNRLTAAGDIVTDFNVNEDLLNYSGLFSNFNITISKSNPLSDYLKLEQVGADTVVKFDLDGKGGSSTLTTLMTLQNVQASTIMAKNIIV